MPLIFINPYITIGQSSLVVNPAGLKRYNRNSDHIRGHGSFGGYFHTVQVYNSVETTGRAYRRWTDPTVWPASTTSGQNFPVSTTIFTANDTGFILHVGLTYANSRTTDMRYSRDFGATWTNGLMPSNSYWRSAAFGNDKCVAIGTDSNSTGKTVIAINTPSNWSFSWAQIDAPVTIYDIAFVNGLFFAHGGSKGTSHTSPDGLTWTSAASKLPATPSTSLGANMRSLNGRLFVTCGTQLLTTTDAVTWQICILPSEVTVAIADIVYVAGKGYVAGTGGASVITSPDGITWSYTALPSVASSTHLMCVGNNVIMTGMTTAYYWVLPV